MMRLEPFLEQARPPRFEARWNLISIHVKLPWHQCTNVQSADSATTVAGGIKHLQIAQAYPR
jgi:hypothetical protein